jgi:hypothetical protein
MSWEGFGVGLELMTSKGGMIPGLGQDRIWIMVPLDVFMRLDEI